MSALSTDRAGVSREAFAVGMFTLAKNAGRQLDPETIELFYQQLCDEMTEREWAAVVKRALEETSGRNPWSTVGDLRRHLYALRRAAIAPAGSRPPEDELRALEAQADAEAGRA